MRTMAALGLALGLSAAANTAAGEPTLAEAEAALTAMNALARSHYAAAKAAALDAAGPVIVVAAEDVALLRSGEAGLREVERIAYLPARYRHLKALGHVPLGLWSLLAPRAGRPAIPPAAALAAYRAHVAALEPVIGTLGLRWDDARRQREILSLTLALIDEIAPGKGVTPARLDAYAYDVGPALLGNAYDAAEAQLEALHAIVRRWRAGMAPADWERLHVVVLGPNRPREAQPPWLYFRRLLGPAAATRLVSADNVSDIAPALDLLAAQINDRRIAHAFFAESARLERGLLSDATERHLARLLP